MNNIELKRQVAPFLVFLAVCIYIAPIFKNPDALINDDPYRYHDYLQQATYDFLFRQSILEHHQFPLRTHMLGGGYPLIANPQDTTFSPFVLTTLVFGEALGIKINILLFFLIGAGGMFLLSRKGLGLPITGAAFAACAYCFSAWWASRIEWGFYFKLYFHLFPLIFYFYIEGKKRTSHLIYAAMLLVVAATQIGLGLVVIFLFIGIYEVIDYFAKIKESRKPVFIKQIALLVLLVLLLGAARIVPMAKLISQNSRQVGPYSTYMDTDPGRPNFYKSPAHFGFALTHYDSIPNYPIHPGWITLFLALIGGAAFIKKSWKYVALTCLFIAFSFGPYFFIDLWRPLYYLPMFNSMHQPYQLINYFILFGITILAAYSFLLFKKLPGKTLPLIISLLPFLFLIQPWQDNGHIYSKTFTKKAPVLKGGDKFYQIRASNQVRGAPRSPHSHQYFNVLRNVGTIDWDGDVLLPENTECKFFVDMNDNIKKNKSYKGEAYLENGSGTAEIVSISPNRILVKATNFAPDRLIINQNFDPGWNGPLGFEIENHNGLLSLGLNRAATWEIELGYLPFHIIMGIVISLLSFAGAIFYLKRSV